MSEKIILPLMVLGVILMIIGSGCHVLVALKVVTPKKLSTIGDALFIAGTIIFSLFLLLARYDIASKVDDLDATPNASAPSK